MKCFEGFNLAAAIARVHLCTRMVASRGSRHASDRRSAIAHLRLMVLLFLLRLLLLPTTPCHLLRGGLVATRCQSNLGKRVRELHRVQEVPTSQARTHTTHGGLASSHGRTERGSSVRHGVEVLATAVLTTAEVLATADVLSTAVLATTED